MASVIIMIIIIIIIITIIIILIILIMCPLLVLKGIYHYRKYVFVFFPGDLSTRGLKQKEVSVSGGHASKLPCDAGVHLVLVCAHGCAEAMQQTCKLTCSLSGDLSQGSNGFPDSRKVPFGLGKVRSFWANVK